MDVWNRSVNVDLSNYVKSGEFDLVNVHQKRRVVRYACCLEPYPGVVFYVQSQSTRFNRRCDILHSHSTQDTLLHVQCRLSLHDDERSYVARLLSTARQVQFDAFQMLF